MSHDYESDKWLRLMGLASEGEATPEQMAQLAAALEADSHALRLYVEYMSMQADLQWSFDEKWPLPVEMRENEKGEGGDLGGPKSARTGRPHSSAPPRRSPGAFFVGHLQHPAGWPLFLAATLLAVVVGSTVTAWWLRDSSDKGVPLVAQVTGPPGAAISVPHYSAKLVNINNCRWDSSRMRDVHVGDQLAPGQSLQLLEGIAEIVTTHSGGGTADYVLEGPVSLIITESGLPVLEYGKLSGAVSTTSDGFSISTPIGTIRFGGDGAFGIVAAPDDVVVHAFRGDQIVFEPARSIDLVTSEASYRVPEGTSLRLGAGKSGLQVDRGEANERSFVANLSATSSHLNIPQSYVDAVRAAEPLAYWRFERINEGVVKNTVGDTWNCVLKGDVNWLDYQGNRVVEFGVASNPGQFMTDESFSDRLRKAYTIAVWVKPSHFHEGSFVGLVNWSPDTPSVSHHGLSLECCGPASPWRKEIDRAALSAEELRLPGNYPSRWRFLHRNPPARRAQLGNSCYSDNPYEPRRWQFVVATKQEDHMKLFVNGQQVAETQEPTPCPDDLSVLIGQNWPLGFRDKPRDREFVGELDEVAIYDRALTAEEIQRQYDLVPRDNKSIIPRNNVPLSNPREPQTANSPPTTTNEI